jgi:hypothetical protein
VSAALDETWLIERLHSISGHFDSDLGGISRILVAKYDIMEAVLHELCHLVTLKLPWQVPRRFEKPAAYSAYINEHLRDLQYHEARDNEIITLAVEGLVFMEARILTRHLYLGFVAEVVAAQGLPDRTVEAVGKLWCSPQLGLYYDQVVHHITHDVPRLASAGIEWREEEDANSRRDQGTGEATRDGRGEAKGPAPQG